jgi:hypothetical protein
MINALLVSDVERRKALGAIEAPRREWSMFASAEAEASAYLKATTPRCL